MEELNGVTIYWLISIGMLIGFIIDLIMIKRGVGMIANLLCGAASSVLIGVIAIMFHVYASLIFAAIGTIALLFLVNVFSIHVVDDGQVGSLDS